MLTLLVCLVSVADVQAAPPPDEVTLSKAEQQFSTELFQVIAADTNYTKNVFFSPYSVFNALLTVYVASAGKTEISLEKFLRFDASSKPDKNYITGRILNETSKSVTKQYELTSLDRIYYTPEFKIKSDKQKQFNEKVAVFKSEDEINNWVSNSTKGMIQNFLEKGEIKPPAIVFVNAAYFKGNWTNQFTGVTSKNPFTLSDGTVTETLLMSVEDKCFQLMTDPEIKAQIIYLPYKGDDISMIIILPTTKPTKGAPPPLADVVKKLTNTKFQKIVSDLQTQNISQTKLYIPKFESEEKYQLKKIFEKLGDKELFTEDLNLTNIFEPGTPLHVKAIIHQAKVNVYETGTEAGAATAGIAEGLTPTPPLPTFRADHPFVYIIYDKTNSYIHYVGIFNSPTNK